MVRYPHTGTISYIDVPIFDTDGNDVSVPVTKEIQCRVEFNSLGSGRKDLDYKAKVYCSVIDEKFFRRDGMTFEFKSKEFKITLLVPFQRHTEIWIE